MSHEAGVVIRRTAFTLDAPFAPLPGTTRSIDDFARCTMRLAATRSGRWNVHVGVHAGLPPMPTLSAGVMIHMDGRVLPPAVDRSKARRMLRFSPVVSAPSRSTTSGAVSQS